MIRKSAIILAVFICMAFSRALPAQENASAQAAQPQTSSNATEEQNIKEYITLLRKDIRSQKSAVMSSVMQLDADQAAKFWPIYRDYDAELNKLNDLRVANITEYSKSYTNLTDEKADELVHNAMSYQRQRAELLAKYYDRVKQSLGAVTAARFVQVESQLLLLIDLQIDSSLPIAGS